MPPSPTDPPWLARWDALYLEAVAFGGHDTGSRVADERLERPLRLLTQALRRLVVVAIAAPAIACHADDPIPAERTILLAGRLSIAGALRLTDRALEVHARDVGYDPGHWPR
jgi:hypothetical protein